MPVSGNDQYPVLQRKREILPALKQNTYLDLLVSNVVAAGCLSAEGRGSDLANARAHL